MSASEYIDGIDKAAALITSQFPDKSIFFVLKDPETTSQEAELKALFSVKTIKQAYKTITKDLLKKYTNIRFVIAYGAAKSRDDFTAIWLTDILGESTILLSRDRYRDISDMYSNKVKFVVYGKDATKYNKKLNLAFPHISRGIIKNTLIGYSFRDDIHDGFYKKATNKRSMASDIVYIIMRVNPAGLPSLEHPLRPKK